MLTKFCFWISRNLRTFQMVGGNAHTVYAHIVQPLRRDQTEWIRLCPCSHVSTVIVNVSVFLSRPSPSYSACFLRLNLVYNCLSHFSRSLGMHQKMWSAWRSCGILTVLWEKLQRGIPLVFIFAFCDLLVLVFMVYMWFLFWREHDTIIDFCPEDGICTLTL